MTEAGAGARWTGRRLAVVALIWTSFALIQTVLGIVSSPAGSSWQSILYMDLLMAIEWMLLTPLIADWSRFVTRWAAHPIRFGGAHLVGIVLVSAIDAWWGRYLAVAFGEKLIVSLPATMLFFADVTFISYCAIAMASRALHVHGLYAFHTRRELRLRAQVALARLRYLEAQLRPHFLFNTLGSITELAHESPRAAARMLRQLGVLLRFALEGRGDDVTLREELSALEPYLDIQRVRFEDWLVIESAVDPEALCLHVPRLTLQPLVENALRHGLANRTSAGQICIAARLVDGALRLSVSDNGAGLGERSQSKGYGIGLSNMRERLATIYGDEASLSLTASPEGRTVAEVRLPLRYAPIVEDTDAAGDAPASVTAPLLEWSRHHPALALLAGWSVWGIVWLQQSLAYSALRNRLGTLSIPQLVLEHAIAVGIWALLTPLVFVAARRFPLDPDRIRWTSLVHIPLACAFALTQAALWSWLVPTQFKLWSPAYVTTMLWSTLVYGVLVGVALFNELTGWLRERDVAASRLHAELAEARLQTTTTRTQPEMILETLEALAVTVIVDPRETERALTALATQLRRSLEGALGRVENEEALA